ncbi:hypothetical protein K503DRAFT_316408 [Rhizopogon vinicolor AM-OR11-026]|uniref:Uncharacterized protein n=1 Tax=Rhizopogon vinicolor AM-OR11-026 TaxID=1314800 RepID=A0A1B7NCV1_9AGAM|nr:hypothetical protein K503DRAFT_316408 [Rhizopogon vinicolor AM-OR11-026]
MQSSPPDTVTRGLWELSDAPSIEWMFKTSADPEVIGSVAWMLPTVEWTRELHIATVCPPLLSAFRTCFHGGFQLSVSARQLALACGRALHHIACDETIQKLNSSNDNDQHFDWDSLELWSAWHDIALPWGLKACRTSFDLYATTQDENHENQARTALRLAIVTGCPGFLKPNDVTLIWDGVFDWNNANRVPKDFDWLVDFLVHFRTFDARNFDAMADALLALSAMQGLGSPEKRDNYLDTIIFSMEADKPSRLRHAALRAVFDARLQLVEIADDKEGDSEFREQLLTDLPSALLTMTKLVAPQLSAHDSDAIFNPGREYFYLQLIFTLAKQSDWRDQLEKAGHIDRCVVLLDHVINLKDSSTGLSEPVKTHPYYLAGTLIRLDASGSYRSSCFADKISELEWWKLLKGAWSAMWWNDLYREDELLEALPGIVTYTLESLETETAKYDSKSLIRMVDRIYEALKDEEAEPGIISAVKSVKDRLDSGGS